MTAAIGRQALSFATIGVAGTATYFALYAGLRPVLLPEAANIVARVVVAVPTTWLNARYTFGTSGGWRRVMVATLVSLAVTTAVSGGAIALEQRLAGPADVSAEMTAVVLGHAAALSLRFVLFRFWLFRIPAPIAIPTEKA